MTNGLGLGWRLKQLVIKNRRWKKELEKCPDTPAVLPVRDRGRWNSSGGFWLGEGGDG